MERDDENFRHATNSVRMMIEGIKTLRDNPFIDGYVADDELVEAKSHLEDALMNIEDGG